MRWIIILIPFIVAGCSNAPSHELPQTSDKDPTWQLNPDKWTFKENALFTPPVGKVDPPQSASVKAVVP